MAALTLQPGNSQRKRWRYRARTYRWFMALNMAPASALWRSWSAGLSGGS